ncbi:uncharacterized protein VTP21DRAFT_3955 [Calcarisporiella thermophila]|uniref:uncharacterized protein n=1 Tax=Calcarisporiella thermophila TaxID=911321 RepID=UPI0037441A46
MATVRRSTHTNTSPASGIAIEQPMPSASITNKPASPAASLYHLCRSVLDRLKRVPGFDEFLNISDDPPPPLTPGGSTELPPPLFEDDPLHILWQICRKGYSLCALFNALDPEKPLRVNSENLSNANQCKASVYHFLLACRDQLKLAEDSLFSITDVFQNNTNGFVKVVRTINIVLDRLEEKGVLQEPKNKEATDDGEQLPLDSRAKVVNELRTTELKYVQDLEILQNYMNQLQAQQVVSADTIHHLFANLNALVDFQRRFLMALEANADKPPAEQRFGELFVRMEDAFSVYEPYCTNYSSALDLAVQETPNLMKLSELVEPTYELPSLLIKPVQRVCKYSLLMAELNKYTDKSHPYFQEQTDGLNAIKRVVDKVNETKRKQENALMVEELKTRVDDWKGLTLDNLGELVLVETFIMSSNDMEREMKVYLFERALLFFKYVGDKNRKNTKTNSITLMKKRRGSLVLKLKVPIANINIIMNTARNGVYTLKVFWSDVEMESFVLKCRNEEVLQQWEPLLNKLVSEIQQNGGAQSARRSGLSSAMQSMDLRSPTTEDYPSSVYDDEFESEEGGDGEVAKPRSTSVQYARKTQATGARPRARTEDSSSFAYWGSQTPPLPHMARQYAQPGANPHVPPLPRSFSASTAATMSSVYSGSTLPTEYSSSSTLVYSPHDSTHPPHPRNRGSLRDAHSASSSPLTADTFAKFMMAEQDPHSRAGDEEELDFPQPPLMRSQSDMTTARTGANVGLGLYYNGAGNGQAPPAQPRMPRGEFARTRLRSQSNPHQPLHVRKPTPNHMAGSVEEVPPLPQIPSSDAESPLPSPVSNGPSIRIKVNYGEDVYVIMASTGIGYRELADKVERKMRLVAGKGGGEEAGEVSIPPLRIKYVDEDGDLVTIRSDDDVQMAFEACGSTVVNLFVS